jgi:hypothetical protein
MGGYGSGWQGAKKATVEGSLVLTAASLVRKRALVAGERTSGSLGWISDREDKPHATIGYEADLSDQDNAWLRLHYRRNGEPADYRVRLVTSTPHYGGLRCGLSARWFGMTEDRRAAWRNSIPRPVESISDAARATR